jgi:hypothetical protein
LPPDSTVTVISVSSISQKRRDCKEAKIETPPKSGVAGIEF